MDVDAIFQQINLRYEWAIWVSAILTLNRMDVDMIFFSFNYSSSLSTSQSQAKTPLPDSVDCSSTPSEVSAIPCEHCSWTIEIFSATPKFPSLGFWPRCGGNYLPYVNWSCKLDEYNLPSLSNLMFFLSIKDLVYSAMVNVADGGCWSLTCDYLALATKTDVIVNVGQCLNRSIWEIKNPRKAFRDLFCFQVFT